MSGTQNSKHAGLLAAAPQLLAQPVIRRPVRIIQWLFRDPVWPFWTNLTDMSILATRRDSGFVSGSKRMQLDVEHIVGRVKFVETVKASIGH